MSGKLPACRACPYFSHDTTKSEGPIDADVVFVGDSPWKTEAKYNRVFVGPAGEVFDDLLDTAGLDRRDVYICNTVKCVPSALGVPHPKKVVELCTRLYLKRELAQINPKLIVPMGNVAIKALGIKEAITSVRGVVRDVEYDGEQYTTLPTYHPSFINRRPAYKPFGQADFKAIKYYLDRGHEQPMNNDLDYQSVTTTRELDAFFAEFEKAKWIAWDTETTGLDYRTDKILSMQFSFAPKTGYCVPFFRLPYDQNGGAVLSSTHNTEIITKFYSLLHDTSKVYFFHNIKFDLRMMHAFFLATIGLPVQIDSIRGYDTMSMYGLLDENTPKNLKSVSRMHTDLRYTKEELAVVKDGQMKQATLEEMTAYGTKDADATRRIALKFGKQIRDQNLWGIFVTHEASDMRIAKVLFKMELFGAPVDYAEMQKLQISMQERLTHYYQQMERVVGHPFNPNSDAQLRKILFDELELPVSDKKTGTGLFSIDKFVIADLVEKLPNHPFLQPFRMRRNYASIEKMSVRALFKKLGDDGRLHPDFGVTTIVSGRVACYRPNLTQIPREREFEEGVYVSIRSVFAANPGKIIIYADASQIEFKMSAILSGDKALIYALFVDHEDFHNLVARTFVDEYEEHERLIRQYQASLLDTALSAALRRKLSMQYQSSGVFLKGWRTRAKNFNFGRNYGAQNKKLAQTMGVTEEAVERFVARLAERFPDFERYLEDIPKQALEDQELISVFHRRRHFPASGDAYVQASQGRQGSNFCSQAAAAYTIRAALVRIAEAFERVGMASYPFNLVYDAILVETPNEEVEDALDIVATEMLAPVPELDNHVFGIELGAGQSWKIAEGSAVKLYSLEDLSKVKSTIASSLKI